MAPNNQYNVREAAQSLANSIQDHLVQPSENKFDTLLQKTRVDFDHRARIIEEKFTRRLDELNSQINELQVAKKKLNIFNIILGLVVITSIVIQMI